MQETIDKLGVETRNVDFTEIKLNKQCPSCASYSLSRDIDFDKQKVPIMPTYVCAQCQGKSYYLSDSYLNYLVSDNSELFSEKELKEMTSNKEAFLSELKEYIIRIFASKRIIRIK